MWVWTSMPPGITYLPLASSSSSAAMPAPVRFAPIAAMVSPSMRTSAEVEPSAVTMVPLVMSLRIGPSWTTASVGQEADGSDGGGATGAGSGGRTRLGAWVRLSEPDVVGERCQLAHPDGRDQAARDGGHGDGHDAFEHDAPSGAFGALALVAPERIVRATSSHHAHASTVPTPAPSSAGSVSGRTGIVAQAGYR